MSNVTHLHQSVEHRMEIIRSAVDAGVSAAFAKFSADQVHQLIMASYIELHQEAMESNKVAA